MDALENTQPTELVAARLVAHWAAQIPAAINSALVPQQEDDSHSNLEWSGRADGLLLGRQLSELADGAQDLRVGIRLAPLEVVLRSEEGDIWSRALQGETLQSALESVRAALAEKTDGDIAPTPLRYYEMPDHPLNDGASFDETPSSTGLSQLSSWFCVLTGVFDDLHQRWSQRLDGSSSIDGARIWPHHFDLGGLIALSDFWPCDRIDFGMSPGDHEIHQPYLFVNPYPRPDKLPSNPLPHGGIWHQGGFHGAVLLGTDIVRLGGEQVAAFLDAAIEAHMGIW